MECKNVLVVEDDSDIRDALRDLLQVEGYNVLCAGDGEEGINVLQKISTSNPPCLVVLDLMMPLMDGWDFYKIKQADQKIADIPTVVISAYEGDKGDLSEVPFIKKPIEFQVLLEAVQEHCGAPNS